MDYTLRYMSEYILSGLVMTNTNPQQLTPKAQEILDVLINAGDWCRRSALATKLNKKSLNKWDIILLSKLADAGLIEVRQIPHHGLIGFEWQYRAISVEV